jgi:hypothetical protein
MELLESPNPDHLFGVKWIAEPPLYTLKTPLTDGEDRSQAIGERSIHGFSYMTGLCLGLYAGERRRCI